MVKPVLLQEYSRAYRLATIIPVELRATEPFAAGAATPRVKPIPQLLCSKPYLLGFISTAGCRKTKLCAVGVAMVITRLVHSQLGHLRTYLPVGIMFADCEALATSGAGVARAVIPIHPPVGLYTSIQEVNTLVE